jgi:hypothetical protein
VFIEFDNNIAPMHLAPFDSKITLWIGTKNTLPWIMINDSISAFREKEKVSSISPVTTRKQENPSRRREKCPPDASQWNQRSDGSGGDISYVWDISKDNPEALYKGRAAGRLELDRLIKRLELLNAEKRDLEKKMSDLDSEINTVHGRIEELQKQ